LEAEADLAESREENSPRSMGAGLNNLRLRRANREAVIPVPARLENLLPADHLARKVWQVVSQLELSAFYAEIAVTRDSPGQAAIDPLILVALWVYALSQGETEARRLARLCVEHLAYIWLCGGVAVTYHTLSNFRVQHAQALDGLLTQVVVQLTAAGLVGWEIQAQDGMRVRASAGAASFHRQPTLERTLAEAQQQVATLASPPVAPEVVPSLREQAAQERAAHERVARLEAALEELPAVRAAKATAQERVEARVSSTDPEARVMKMGDGGYRPAYNWEFATDVAQLVIVGVDVVNAGSDKGQMTPMLRQLIHRYGRLPLKWLVDGGFVKLSALEEWAAQVQILAPVPKPKEGTRDPYAPLPSDSPVLAAWRARMGTAAAKETYKLRAATAECVNAQARTQEGVQQSAVRGLAKNRCLAVWVALTHNLLIWIRELGSTFCPPAVVKLESAA
jgi:transposase